MAIRDEIDQKYLMQASVLETEFFDIADKGLPSQRRLLKIGKSIEQFNQRHGDIWRAHEAELIAAGFIEGPIPPEPVRDLAKEIDDLKARIERLEGR